MELILYYIKENGILIISFMVTMLIFGVITYLAIKNFKQEKKIQVYLYGLLLKCTWLDISKLSIISMRLFLLIYAAVIYPLDIYIIISMFVIISIIYVALNFKAIIYEIFYLIISVASMYLINVINSYIAEINTSKEVSYLRIVIIIATILFALYSFLKNVNEITEDRENREINKKQEAEKIEKKQSV